MKGCRHAAAAYNPEIQRTLGLLESLSTVLAESGWGRTPDLVPYHRVLPAGVFFSRRSRFYSYINIIHLHLPYVVIRSASC